LALLTTDPELTYPNGDRCQYISMTFRCSYLAGKAQVGDEESIEVTWFRTDQLPDELPALLRRRIDTALADREACVFDS